MKYSFIAAHQEEFPIIRMCQVLNVSRSVGMMLGANENQASANEKMSV